VTAVTAFLRSKSPIKFYEQNNQSTEVTESMLPANIRGWIIDVCNRIQTFPTFPTVAAISFISSIIARRVIIAPKHYDKGWLVYPNIWCAVVGKAGSQKTPSITPMFEPIRKYDKDMRDLYQLNIEDYEYETAQCKRNRARPEEYPKQPKRHALFTNASTPQALQVTLENNPQGILVYRDELAGFFDELQKKGNEGARQFFLEAWNGNGTFSYDTLVRGSTYINGVCLTLVGSIQPSVLAKQIESANSGKANDGFIQRFQLLVKSSPKPDFNYPLSDTVPDYQAEDLYNTTFKRLLDLPINDKPVVVNFDNAAQDIFDSWYESLERRLRQGKMPEIMLSHLSKYRSLMPSLALIFECIDNTNFNADTLSSDLTISARSARMAIEWCDYLENVAKDILVNDTDTEIDPSFILAEKIIYKIENGEITDGMTMTAFKSKFRGKNDKPNLQSAIELLSEHGWIISEQQKTEGRPKSLIRINPLAFKENAENHVKYVKKGNQQSDNSSKDIELYNITTDNENVKKGIQNVKKAFSPLSKKVPKTSKKVSSTANTDNSQSLTGNKDNQPDLPPEAPIDFYENQFQQTDNVINKPNGYDNLEYSDWVEDDIDNQSTNPPQPEIEFRPKKTVMKNITAALKEMVSGNVYQIAKQAGGNAYAIRLVRQYLDFMDNVKSEKNADGEPIYSLKPEDNE